MSGEPTVSFVGRAGQDADLRYTNSGRAVANISVAVTPRTKDGDNWVDKDTMWFSVSCWRNAEQIVEQVRKGDLLHITGKFGTRSYESKSGETRTDLTVDADTVGVVPTAPKGNKGQDDPW